MLKYNNLFNVIKQEKLPETSANLWTRIEQTLDAKHEARFSWKFWKGHPFWSSASLLAACAVFMFISISLFQTFKLNSYLKDVNLVMNSPESYYSEVKYNIFSE